MRPLRRRRWRSVRRAVAWACVVVALAAVGGLPVYVRPQIDQLRHADAIFILGGVGYDRYPFGIGLGVQGWAPTVVISNPNGPKDAWLTQYCATPQPKIKVQCFIPDPRTTKGEGQELRRLAAQNGWRTIIVVTFRPHVSRARFILERCFDGDLIMVASPPDLTVLQWIPEYLYQTAGYIRAVLQPGC